MTITPEDLRQARADGLTLDEAAERFGCWVSTVTRAEDRHGIRLRRLSATECGRGRKRAITDEQARVLRKRQQAGETVAALAEELGVVPQTLYRAWKRAGIL